MQVTVEDVNSVKKVLHIEVEKEAVSKEFDKAYKQLKKTAKVNGFRPGKAPRSVLERKFGKDVTSDVVNALIQSSLVEAIQENNLEMIGDPGIETKEISADAPFQYTATIELRPEVGDIDFKGLSLKKNLYKATDEELDAQLQMIQRTLATKEAITEDRAAQEGDFLLMTYEGLLDGAPFEGTPRQENEEMKVGSAVLSKDFDDQLVGMKAGETKEFEIEYADSYINTTLAGNKISYKVEVKEIREEVLPELTDEIAPKIGPFETIDQIKEEIVKNLQRGYDKRVEQELNEQAYSALLEKKDFEVPDVMVDYELAGIIAETERNFAMNGITLEQIGKTREDLQKEYRDVAEKQVKRHLILGAIIKQESLELTDEEMEAGYQETAEIINQPVEGIKSFYKTNPDKLEFFKHTLLEQKAARLIIENSDIEEVEPELESKEESGSDE